MPAHLWGGQLAPAVRDFLFLGQRVVHPRKQREFLAKPLGQRARAGTAGDELDLVSCARQVGCEQDAQGACSHDDEMHAGAP